MRGKTLVRAALPVVLCLAAVLWLVWGFLTWPVAGKVFLTLVALLVAGMLARLRYRQQQPVQLADEAGIFPPDSHTGPVLLVCGDVGDSMFAAGQTRGTAQGWYLRITGLHEDVSFSFYFWEFPRYDYRSQFHSIQPDVTLLFSSLSA